MKALSRKLLICMAVMFSSGVAVGVASGLYSPAAQAVEQPALPTIVVHKTPTCSCCGKWVQHLRDHGFTVQVITVANTRGIQAEMGVPRTLGSCHTAKVGDYWVEGHVPADLIRRLIDEKPPGIAGISVPGMPMGSPGMEGPNPVQYDVVAYGTDGSYSRYATRQGNARVE